METQPKPEDETPTEEVVEGPVEEKPVARAEPTVEEPFTIEKGKERAVEAVDRVKQAGTNFSKEITTQPLLDAVGSYFARGIDALVSLAEGLEGKSKKKKDQE